MNQDCARFRSRLSAFLEAQPLDSQQAATPDVYEPLISSIAWNRHLLACLECRRLLNSEQALDELLGSLPNPALSAERQRTLRQRLSVDLRLERLLSISDPYAGAPAGALDRIHEHLHDFVTAQSDRLERGLAHMDSISAPEGMADRIMARVQQEAQGAEVLVPRAQASRPVGGPAQRKPRSGQKLAFQRWFSTGLVAASLAAILWTLPNWFADNHSSNESFEQPGSVAQVSEPEVVPTDQDAIEVEDAELLAMLDRLEVIDLVDELDSEEWELLDDYDRFAIFLMDSGVSNEELDGQGGPR